MDTITFSRWDALRVLSLFAFLASVEPCLHADEKGAYTDVVLPFFKKYCSECHQGEKSEGSFRLDKSIPLDFKNAAVRNSWAEVVDVLNSHSMPPEERPKPEIDAVARMVDWITEQIVQAELQLRENAVVMRRLNRIEYKNTIRDLVGIDFDISGFHKIRRPMALIISAAHFRCLPCNWNCIWMPRGKSWTWPSSMALNPNPFDGDSKSIREIRTPTE